MRLSSTQKDILFILYAMEDKGNVSPVPGMKILEIINNGRNTDIYDTNFRTSCHKLNANGMIEKYRSSQSLNLAWRLSDEGRAKAIEIYNNRR